MIWVYESGHDVVLEDGRVIPSREVLSAETPGRVIGLMQDTCDSSCAEEALRGCDMLIHEATYDKSKEMKARKHGHSTAEMAGMIMRRTEREYTC